MACNCGKPKPGPHGGNSKPTDRSSLIASVGSGSPGRFIHVDSNGARTAFGDLLGARAEVVRRGGHVEII